MTQQQQHHRIAIVGTGFSGLGMAIRLKQQGEEDFVLLERAGDIGGTWRDNTYPGCRCDVPSHLYSFSFAPNPNWSSTFSPQSEILDYLNDFIQQHGYAPSLEEIGRRFGLSSLATVHKHLTNLEEKGFIKRSWNRSRSVELVPTRMGGRAVELPMLGYVAAVQFGDQNVSERFYHRGRSAFQHVGHADLEHTLVEANPTVRVGVLFEFEADFRQGCSRLQYAENTGIDLGRRLEKQ